MSSRSFAGLPLPSVIFRSQSFADISASSQQSQRVPYSSNFARTDAALPHYRHETATTLSERQHGMTALPGPVHVPAQAPQVEPKTPKKKRFHFSTGRSKAKQVENRTPRKTTPSVWKRMAHRMKHSIQGLKIKKKPEKEPERQLEISGPTNFQHLGGAELLATMASATTLEETEEFEDEQAPSYDGSSEWEDVTELESFMERRI